jgi:hypothetical protein
VPFSTTNLRDFTDGVELIRIKLIIFCVKVNDGYLKRKCHEIFPHQTMPPIRIREDVIDIRTDSWQINICT